MCRQDWADFINSSSLFIFEAFHSLCNFIYRESNIRTLLLYRRVFLLLRGVKEFLKVLPPSPKNVIILGKRMSRSVLEEGRTALLFIKELANYLAEYFVCCLEIRLQHLSDVAGPEPGSEMRRLGNRGKSSGKEQELVDESIKYQLDIVELSSTKRQGSGLLNLSGWKLFCSGVDITTRAQAGVGVLVEPHLADRTTDLKPVSVRVAIA
ncbi:unnamed protein product [Soboliphyme baturini]|uniref:Exocyst complex component Sec8 n=1 Tax=Soboliphyme baturini TaxID=241478 RepID=A0A183IIC9_9BILA|nr:unnamed protein product [Soboliphyme baturini]